MRVYEKVRRYIEEMGEPQAAVAERAGIPAAAFAQMLAGARTMYADDLKAICLALNVSPELFVQMQRGDTAPGTAGAERGENRKERET